MQKELQATPMLFPYEPEKFWQQMRMLVQEEVKKGTKGLSGQATPYSTPGLTYKPIYKMDEVCEIFQVTPPTIYDWISKGKLKPKKYVQGYFFYGPISFSF